MRWTSIGWAVALALSGGMVGLLGRGEDDRYLGAAVLVIALAASLTIVHWLPRGVTRMASRRAEVRRAPTPYGLAPAGLVLGLMPTVGLVAALALTDPVEGDALWALVVVVVGALLLAGSLAWIVASGARRLTRQRPIPTRAARRAVLAVLGSEALAALVAIAAVVSVTIWLPATEGLDGGLQLGLGLLLVALVAATAIQIATLTLARVAAVRDGIARPSLLRSIALACLAFGVAPVALFLLFTESREVAYLESQLAVAAWCVALATLAAMIACLDLVAVARSARRDSPPAG